MNPAASFFGTATFLQAHVVRQAVLEWRRRLAPHQRREVAARLLGDAEAVAGDEIARQHLLDVGDFGERRLGDLPAVRLVGDARDRRHHGVPARERQLDRRLADGVALLEVGLRREVARRALQIVGDRPVILVLELVLHERRDQRADAAQLRVAERVLRARLRHQLARRRPCSPSETPTQQ